MIMHIQDILRDWPATFSSLAEAVPSTGRGAMVPLSGLTVLPPVLPRQVFQSGANYRTHVIDLVAAREGDTPEVRSRAAARRRAGSGVRGSEARA